MAFRIHLPDETHRLAALGRVSRQSMCCVVLLSYFVRKHIGFGFSCFPCVRYGLRKYRRLCCSPRLARQSGDQEGRGVVADPLECNRADRAGAGRIAGAQGVGCKRIGPECLEGGIDGKPPGGGLVGVKQNAVGGENRERQIESGDEALHALFQRERRSGGFRCNHQNGGAAVGQGDARAAAGEGACIAGAQARQAFEPRDAIERQGRGDAGNLLCGGICGILGIETALGEGDRGIGVEDRRPHGIGPEDPCGIRRPQPGRRRGDRLRGNAGIAQVGELGRGIVHGCSYRGGRGVPDRLKDLLNWVLCTVHDRGPGNPG